MKMRYFVAACAALLLSAGFSAKAQETPSAPFREALQLYQKGSFDRAAELFGKLDDDLSRGYAALCAVKAGTKGFEKQAQAYLDASPESVLCPQINWAWGKRLFDEGDYENASFRFGRILSDEMQRDELTEYVYKRAYCDFVLGRYETAEPSFRYVESADLSDYTAPSRYSIAYIRYSAKDFAQAYDWFSEAAKDPRFADISHYYMIECRFMQKDYDYVISKGTDFFSSVPEDRQPRLARMISEAYLVKGDVAKAKEYYEKNLLNKAVKNRSDYFYAGSVLYAVEDWQGAIDNYSMMPDRTDSLGQVANYQMAYSLIETRDKVSALGAFADAAKVAFDPAIQEDAYFNYAKLAFDLNNDTSVFEEYLKKYGTRSKGDKIYSYMAMAALHNHDYEGAVAAYDNIDELDEGMKGNYMKAYFLRGAQLIGNGAWRDAVPCLKAAAYYVPRQDRFNQLSRYWLAESYFRSGDNKSARDIYLDLYNLSALDGKPEGDLISYNIAYTYFEEEDFDSAQKWFRNYLDGRHNQFGADAETRIGDCYFFSKDYAKAVTAFEKKMADYPDADDIYPYFRAGVAAGLIGSKDRKVALLENVKNASPNAPYYSEALYELGRAYVAVGNDDDASRAFKTLKANTSDNNYAARSLIELGMIARNQGQYDRSLDYYKQVVETMAGSDYAEDALVAIESLYQIRQEPDAYLAYVESLGDKASRDEGQKDNMYYNTAEQIFLSGNYPKALTTFENYLAKYPSGTHLAQTEYYIGECCRNLGQKEKAVDFYNKAVEDGAEGSFKELSMLNFSSLSYSLGRYHDAYGGYSALLDNAGFEENRSAAKAGMMRSAYKAHEYAKAIDAAEAVAKDSRSGKELVREADYIKAKSCLASSRRNEALTILEKLKAYPSTPEGAEATVLLIQDRFDRGRFDEIEKMVYDFSAKAGGQNYWLAKAFIILGDAFMEKGNAAQAQATYESVRSGYTASDPSDDVLDQVQVRLDKLAKSK